MIYLDNSATTLIKPDGVAKAMADTIGNAGRGAHKLALDSARRIYNCRETLCDLFGATEPENIIFTKIRGLFLTTINLTIPTNCRHRRS